MLKVKCLKLKFTVPRSNAFEPSIVTAWTYQVKMKFIQKSPTNFKISECLHHVPGGGLKYKINAIFLDWTSQKMVWSHHSMSCGHNFLLMQRSSSSGSSRCSKKLQKNSRFVTLVKYFSSPHQVLWQYLFQLDFEIHFWKILTLFTFPYI